MTGELISKDQIEEDGMAKKKEFGNLWKNQTELGKRFGISAIAVGKILIEQGLKDGKVATKRALDEGYATYTPLKDGTPFYLWNVEKVCQVIGQGHRHLTETEIWVNKVKATLMAAQEHLDRGEDKIGYMMADCAYDDVPKNIRDEVKKIVESEDSSQET